MDARLDTDDDALCFAEEDSADGARHEAGAWKLMIVDDDPEVHHVTRLVLADFAFSGRRLEFVSAYSGAEAHTMLAEHPDTAVILLDVVMETEDAGLQLARRIREELKNPFVRIVLRTGQPGQAPEEDVIVQYDINDYKSKTELTATRLFTTVVASLRAYRDVRTLEANKRGLETILKASASIFEIRAIEQFAKGVLTQLTSLLHLEEDALYLKQGGFAATGNGGELRILTGTGLYSDYVDQPVRKALKPDLLGVLEQALAAKQDFYLEDHRYVGYFKSENGTENLLYLQGVPETVTEWERYLLEIFCANVAIAFDNISLNNEIRDTQREIIFKLGEIVETRSRETGNHVKRVAAFSALLGEAYGLNHEELAVLRFASPMHDIGKIAVPDAILNKPDKLTPEEFAVMKTHTSVGFEMLCSSNRELLRAAALIALQHHERFDGKGYPHGLAGNDIHIFGRITAVADVFDALGVKRVYKDAWPLDRITEYFQAERGRAFDPQLVDLFFANIEKVKEIRDAFRDVDELRTHETWPLPHRP
ncbi:MAG: DUF3369 domain-containing protein [Candidatus Hydrogenedentes bacterium]|nr:DUF3369 domain-containing protein [Candidatus Hydrogenedentota bacterium]